MSAVILAVIVVMWAVVLVPMWLRRHEAASESRSADKFSAAMRVLSRRSQSSPDRRYVLMPRRDTGVSVHVSGATAVPKRITSTRPAAAARMRPSLAARRRRTLLVLLGLVGLTFVLAVAGAVPLVIQVLADLTAIAFVVHLRTQARRTAQLRARRRPVPDELRQTAPLPHRGAPRWAATSSEPMIDLAAAEAAAVQAEQATGNADPRAWEPVPVPRPTYTMKPAAPAVSRPPVAPAAAGQPVVAERVDAPADEVDYEIPERSELDEILERRWAVND